MTEMKSKLKGLDNASDNIYLKGGWGGGNNELTKTELQDSPKTLEVQRRGAEHGMHSGATSTYLGSLRPTLVAAKL